MKSLIKNKERMWSVKELMVLRVIRAPGAVKPKLGVWLQQIQRRTPEISVHKSAILGRGPELEGDTRPSAERASGEFYFFCIYFRVTN